MTITFDAQRTARIATATEGYERWAAIYDDSPNPLLGREERHLFPLLGDLRNTKILDLACGTGRWMARLTECGADLCVGIDCSSAMLDAASRKPLIAGNLVRGNCDCLPFKTGTFGLAICSFAIGHFNNLKTFAAEVSRVCGAVADVFVTDLHPSAHKVGWKVGFRDQASTPVEIESCPHRPDEVEASFSRFEFQLIATESLRLEEPERPIFVRAGKENRFEKVSVVPAIISFHFQRGVGGSRVFKPISQVNA